MPDGTCNTPGAFKLDRSLTMSILPHSKRCTKCGVEKPLDQFHKHHIHGHRSHCKECRRTEVKVTDATRLDPDAPKTCRKCNKEKPAKEFDVNPRVSSGYYSTCQECRRATANAWKRANKDRIREYEEKNRDHLRELRREWHIRNHDRFLATRRKHYRTPKARLYGLLRMHERRVAKDGKVTPDQVRELKARQKKCYYCKRLFNDTLKSTLDHVIPLNKGGQHDISNIVLACKSCNSKKGDRLTRLI